MSEHTKTPWRVYTTKSGLKIVGIGAANGEGILDAGFGVWSWNDPEGIANANMVVKAVNNHDALVDALLSLDTLLDFGDEDVGHVWEFEDLTSIKAAFDKARAALEQVTSTDLIGQKVTPCA